MKKRELLAIDVGNTSVSFAYFSKGRVLKSFRLPTKQINDSALRLLKNKFPWTKLEAAAIASVVPPVGLFLRQALKNYFGVKTYLLGKDLGVPIKNKYKKPKQVGMDRLMNAVAAYHDFKKDLILVDFGTAITFDVVSKKGEYLGGVIAPGIEISLEALYQKTALLPRIHLKHPKQVIGRDTMDSIRSGCAYGIGGLCDRIIDEIDRSRGTKSQVIATGGYAAFMTRYCRSIRIIDPNLVMKGIAISYQSGTKSK